MKNAFLEAHFVTSLPTSTPALSKKWPHHKMATIFFSLGCRDKGGCPILCMVPMSKGMDEIKAMVAFICGVDIELIEDERFAAFIAPAGVTAQLCFLTDKNCVVDPEMKAFYTYKDLAAYILQ
jgi:hypothetical protein